MKPYVLIVEDDPALVELLQYNFECEGYETGVAREGESAVLSIEERAPDLVVLDWIDCIVGFNKFAFPNSQGIAATQLRCGGKYYLYFAGNFMRL